MISLLCCHWYVHLSSCAYSLFSDTNSVWEVDINLDWVYRYMRCCKRWRYGSSFHHLGCTDHDEILQGAHPPTYLPPQPHVSGRRLWDSTHADLGYYLGQILYVKLSRAETMLSSAIPSEVSIVARQVQCSICLGKAEAQIVLTTCIQYVITSNTIRSNTR